MIIAFSGPPTSYSSPEEKERVEKERKAFENSFVNYLSLKREDEAKETLKRLASSGMITFGVLFINAAIWSFILGRGPTEMTVNGQRRIVDESEILAPALMSLSCFSS